jgi:hypothetical protein
MSEHQRPNEAAPDQLPPDADDPEVQAWIASLEEPRREANL